jgi:hypothetical protein
MKKYHIGDRVKLYTILTHTHCDDGEVIGHKNQDDPSVFIVRCDSDGLNVTTHTDHMEPAETDTTS